MKTIISVALFFSFSVAHAGIYDVWGAIRTHFDSQYQASSEAVDKLAGQKANLQRQIVTTANSTVCQATDAAGAAKCAEANRKNADAIDGYSKQLDQVNKDLGDAQKKLDTEEQKLSGQYAKEAETGVDSTVDSATGAVKSGANAVTGAATSAKNKVVDKATAAQKATTDYVKALAEQSAINQKYYSLRDKVTNMKSDSQDMKNQVRDLENSIDKTNLALYMQEKMAKLLNSDVLCKATKECGTGTRDVKRTDLSEVFTSLSSSGGAAPAATGKAAAAPAKVGAGAR